MFKVKAHVLMTMDLATNPLGHNKETTTTTTTTYKCVCDNKIEESFWSHNPGLVKQYTQEESSKTSRTFITENVADTHL